MAWNRLPHGEPDGGAALLRGREDLPDDARIHLRSSLLERRARRSDAHPLAAGGFHPRVEPALLGVDRLAVGVGALPIHVPVTMAESPCCVTLMSLSALVVQLAFLVRAT